MIGMYLSAFRIGSYIVGDDVGSSMIDNTLKGITAGATSATAYGSTAGRAALTTVKVGARTAAGTATSLRDAGTLARKGLLGSTVREGANNAMYSAGNTIKSAKDKLDNTSIFRK